MRAPLSILLGLLVLAATGTSLIGQTGVMSGQDSTLNDLFGLAVAASGNLVASGAIWADPDGLADSGAVYLFNCTTRPCVQITKITAPSPEAADYLGSALAMEGNLLVAGARGDDVSGKTEQGSAYVFDCSSLPCTLKSHLIDTVLGESGTELGRSVSISQGIVAVGAWLYDLGKPDSGAIFLFDCSGADCTLISRLGPSDAVSSMNMGFSVANYGKRVVAGAPKADGTFIKQGAVYLFDCTFSCTQISKMFAPDPSENANFGSSLAFNKDLVFIGAPGIGFPTESQGAVYVFQCKPTSCSYLSKIVAPDPQASALFGTSVAFDSTRLVVGAPGDASSKGSIYIYNCIGFSCTFKQKVSSKNGLAGDQLGLSVALSGNVAFAGAPYYDGMKTDQGAFFSFEDLINDQDQTTLAGFYSTLVEKERGFTWDTTIPLCNQFGVTCTDLRVTELQLDNRGVQGTIPTTFGKLDKLRVLNLASNVGLTGTIPTEIGKLLELTDLILSSSPKLNGSIPTEIGELPKLANINLSNCSLTGTLPSELGALSLLESLAIGNNILTGTIPTELGGLGLLGTLDLQGNRLTGTIPNELRGATSLEVLFLQANLLTGSIPRVLEDLPLIYLSLAGGNRFCPELVYATWAQFTDSPAEAFPCDPCSPNPCENGGTCLSAPGEVFSCACADGFDGINCQTNDDGPTCSGHGTKLEGDCSCFSGYTGLICAHNELVYCAPPPAEPLSTEPVAEFKALNSTISGSVFTFLLESPARASRYFSISLGGAANCTYPASTAIWKRFDDQPACIDSFVGTFTIPEVVQTCGFTQSVDGQDTLLTGEIVVRAVDVVGSFRGQPVTRTTTGLLNLILRLPSFVNVTTTGLTLLSPISTMAAITKQEYDGLLDTATVEVTISVQWPYTLTSSILDAFPQGLGSLAMLSDLECQDQASTACLQVVTLLLSNVASSQLCQLDGDYGLTLGYGCRPSQGSCPVHENATLSLSFALASESVCGQVEVSASLTGTLEAFDSSAFASSQKAFVAGQRIFLKAKLVSDVSIQAISFAEISIVKSGRGAVVIVSDDAPVPFYNETISFEPDEGTLPPKEFGFSFLATYGPAPTDLFDSTSPAGVFEVTIKADLIVHYATTFGRKRDTLTASVPLTRTVVFVAPRN